MVNETYHPRGERIDGFAVGQHPLYYTWADMKARCNNPSDTNYGERGIGYCPRWMHFANFAADMGAKPSPEASLERIDNAKGYSPSNCKWATRTDQCLNRRRFKNNTSGVTGVVRRNGGFHARFDCEGHRYDLGNFDTIVEAEGYRRRFIELFEQDDPAAFEMLGRRVRRDSTVGIRGISAHTKGGYVVRKTVAGTRRYLGFSPTLAGAMRLLGVSDDRR